MSKRHQKKRLSIWKAKDEVRYWKNLTILHAEQNDNLVNLYSKVCRENDELRKENEKFTLCETVTLKAVSRISNVAILNYRIAKDKAEEFAKRDATESLLRSLKDFVEIKFEDVGMGERMVIAEITVKRTLNEEIKGRMIYG